MTYKAILDGIEALEAKHGPHLKLRVAYRDIIAVVSQLQFALKHPKNTGATAKAARQFAEFVIETLAADEPELASALWLGFEKNGMPCNPYPDPFTSPSLDGSDAAEKPGSAGPTP